LYSLVVFVFSSNSLFAQDDDDQDKNFLKLRNGSYVFGDSIKIKYTGYHSNFFGNITYHHKFLVDGKEYKIDDIRFIKLQEEYIAIVNDIKMRNAPDLAYRIEAGKINFYKSTLIKKTTQTTSRKNYYYFNMGENKPKIANYRNLKRIVVNKELAMEHLKKYKNLKIAEYAIGGIGLGFLAATMTSKMIYVSSHEVGDPKGYLINPTNSEFGNFFINVGIAGIVYMLSGIPEKYAEDNLLLSVKAYNSY
jgi:hypothetical protein